MQVHTAVSITYERGETMDRRSGRETRRCETGGKVNGEHFLLTPRSLSPRDGCRHLLTVTVTARRRTAHAIASSHLGLARQSLASLCWLPELNALGLALLFPDTARCAFFLLWLHFDHLVPLVFPSFCASVFPLQGAQYTITVACMHFFR